MATAVIRKTLKCISPSAALRTLSNRRFGSVATAGEPELDGLSSSFTFSSDGGDQEVHYEKTKDDSIYLKAPKTPSFPSSASSSVTMSMSFTTGSIVGKRFYKQVTTRKAEDGNGWSVMLDYRTLKTPSKRPLKCPTLALAKAIAAEWEYQQTDGIRPFTMSLMKLACTALERVPLTRPKIIQHLMKKLPQDLVFCRAPGDNDITLGVLVQHYTCYCSSRSSSH
ncbi:ATP synthase mitochondrial F1 complex assembly factor 2 like [Actinidia chinensis var. chinensis]|uniref:ATP synthase mitochondrial F1 complex assembly factor 2 like n=1 Tax=Actinidia chinensis var. chinensis TaxID=1590841 RepID=A0A2R6RTN7_ACTCC|nr:ATP synthase mitochondrial F1 complex assembly factor 2 like [Actinidia chinensis var. chinensis]